MFYGIIAVIGLGLWLLFSGSSKKDEEIKLGGSPEEQQARIDEMNKRRDEMVKVSEKSGNRNPQWRDAQSLYLQGFRDYKKGQFTRAIESFRGALSIYPSHQLASRYLTLARRKQDELIQANLSRAREYRERGMYQKCSAHFAMSMTLLAEPTNALYKEAKAGLEECNLYVEGRY
jgi:tetratricopeptide (TPR) repeat protein